MSVLPRGLLLLGLYVLSALAPAEEAYQMPPMHHPVEITVPSSMQVHEDLELGPEGELVCETCHGIEDLKQIPLDEVDINAPDFLNLGPYRDLTDFCYRCHEKEGHERYNLHLMIDEKGEIDERGCEYCHIEVPDTKQTYKADELEFHLSRDKLCYGCHLKTPHLNALNHQTEPTDEIREVIRKAEEKHEVKLPLGDEGEVICITCHSPHQSGVIDLDTPAGKVVEDQPIEEGIASTRTAWGRVFANDKTQRLEALAQVQKGKPDLPEYLRVEKEILLRLPAKDGTLCLSCHEFED